MQATIYLCPSQNIKYRLRGYPQVTKMQISALLALAGSVAAHTVIELHGSGTTNPSVSAQ